MTQQKVICIVDPLSSGSFLAPLFLRKGCRCVAVMSPNTPAVIASTMRKENFEEIMYYDESKPEVTLNRLRELSVHAVVTGSESGVELSDLLSSSLGLRTNGVSTAHVRRNKYYMQEAIREKGIRAVRQIMSSCVTEVLEWAATANKNEYPIIIKPVSSAGTDGVRLCHNEEEVRDAFDSIVGKANCFGEVNDCVLAQEYLKGTEYVVDTVSMDGQHYVTTFWKYEKKCIDGAIVYVSMDILPFEGHEQTVLREYIFKCLDALEIANGPAHSEVMFLTDGTACLVETGSRMHGEKGPVYATEAVGNGQLELTVDVYLGGELFSQVVGKPYSLYKQVREVFFICDVEGELEESLEVQELKDMPAFFTMTPLVQPGQKLQRTINLFTSPARVVLMHESTDVMDDCVNKIREVEKSVYKVAPPPSADMETLVVA